MRLSIFVILIVFATILSCDNNDILPDIDGRYVGTFERDENISNVELSFSNKTFSGASDRTKFPAICNGNYSISNGTIRFTNECFWTAEFDWSLILNENWDFSLTDNTLTLTNSIGDVYVLTKEK